MYKKRQELQSTEAEGNYQNLENLTTDVLLRNINSLDKTVPMAVEACLVQIEQLCEKALNCLQKQGKIFYIGSGTSGRLGIVDASELPPTYGVTNNLVIGLIAGGDGAIRKAVEGAEDNPAGGWNDLKKYAISNKDFVLGIAASGKTPYVVGALKKAQANKIPTGCITCNVNTEIEKYADYPIVCQTGAEFVSGSTRMKAGTAQKLILNMISTTLMIKTGHVHGNKMVDMQLTNQKLIERGVLMLERMCNIDKTQAEKVLMEAGSVRKAMQILMQ